MLLGLNKFSQLIELILSSNYINDFHKFGSINLNNLIILDLSFNKIKSINGFPSFVNLKKLILNYNFIDNIDSLTNIDHKLPNLELLDLRG